MKGEWKISSMYLGGKTETDPYTQRMTILKHDRRTVRIITNVVVMPSTWGVCAPSEVWVTNLTVSAGDLSRGITRFSSTQDAADKEHTNLVQMAILMGFEMSRGHTSYRHTNKKNPERR